MRSGILVRRASSMASATPFSGVTRPTKARYEPPPSRNGSRSRGRPWWIVATQLARGDQRRWLSLMATSGMSLNSSSSSGMPGVVQSPVQRGEDRRGAEPSEQEPQRLHVAMDDVEARALLPDLGQGEVHVGAEVAAVLSRPEALLHGRHQLRRRHRVGRREEGDLVAALVKLVDQGRHDALSPRVGRGRDGQHGRRHDGDAQRPVAEHLLPRLARCRAISAVVTVVHVIDPPRMALELGGDGPPPPGAHRP